MLNFDKNTKAVKVVQIPWQKAGLSYTASGYGKKIPTEYMVCPDKRWYRVYCRICSNIGTLYIIMNGKEITVDIY